MSTFNPAAYLEYAHSLLDERNPNPARYVPALCTCGAFCIDGYDRCEECLQRQEQPHEAPQAQAV